MKVENEKEGGKRREEKRKGSMKNSLYKLPKDILVDLLMKSYDFDKLSIEEAYEIHKIIQKKYREKYEKELDTCIKIMKTCHYIGGLRIMMEPVNLYEIYIAGKIRIALFSKSHTYRFFFEHSSYKTLDELLGNASLFLKDTYNLSEEGVQKMIDQIKVYIDAFDKKQFLSVIQKEK